MVGCLARRGATRVAPTRRAAARRGASPDPRGPDVQKGEGGENMGDTHCVRSRPLPLPVKLCWNVQNLTRTHKCVIANCATLANLTKPNAPKTISKTSSNQRPWPLPQPRKTCRMEATKTNATTKAIQRSRSPRNACKVSCAKRATNTYANQSSKHSAVLA